MKKYIAPKSRKENLVVQELDGEVLIYDLNKNKAFCLNKTSALVWQSCDGSRTIADISDAVGKQLNSQVNEDIVWLALDQLSKENLVEKQTENNDKFNGLSRREVIRKVGLASIVALPLVTSLVAPKAIHAASNCIVGAGTCSCQGPNGGQGNICTATVSTCNTGCVCRFANSGNTNGVCAP
jgi:Coenzyme PQQ synthesis protein D (PqqD)